MIVYGKNVAKEYLEKNKKIKQAIVYKKLNDQELINLLKIKNIKINWKEKYEMDNIVSGLHQGIILDVDDYKYCSLESLMKLENSFIIILDHIEDPHNFGAIIRTCEAAGITDIVIPRDRSVSVNSTVMKTSVGCLDRVRIASVTNLVQTIEYLKKNSYWVIGTDMDGTDYKKIDYSGKIVIIVGNEGSGMSRLVKESCDFIASIPMKGTVNSLNASVATAIILFEARR